MKFHNSDFKSTVMAVRTVKYILFLCLTYFVIDDSVSVINAGTLTLAEKIPVGRSPFGMAADSTKGDVAIK